MIRFVWNGEEQHRKGARPAMPATLRGGCLTIASMAQNIGRIAAGHALYDTSQQTCKNGAVRGIKSQMPTLLAAVALAACTSPTVPTPEISQQLRSLQPDLRAYSEGASLVLNAWVIDSAADPRATVKVVVRSSSGDEESLVLRPHVCTDPAGSLRPCRMAAVHVTQGRDIRALISRLNDMGALLMTDRGNGSGVVLFQDGDPAKSTARIRAWPEVIAVHADGLECMVYLCAIIGSGPSHSPARLIGGIPVRADEAVKKQDGRLQSQPGDMVTVQHQVSRGEAFVTWFELELSH